MNAIVYIKLPLYVHQFLRQKYCKGGADSGEAVRLNHEMHPAGQFLYQHLESNYKIDKWGMLSLSDQIFSLTPKIVPDEFADRLPSDEYRRFYLPFRIEEQHYFNGVLIPGDRTAQLKENNARVFRELIFNEFWADFDSYKKAWDASPELRKHHKVEMQQMIIDYMFSRDIDLDNLDALMRVIKRRKHNASIPLEARPSDYTKKG